MGASNGTSLSLEDRRKAVLSVMDDAANSAGIPRELLGGIWKIESSYGRNLTSPTGCEGDFQFLSSTFAGEIKNNGSKIAERLRAQGQNDLADTVENYSKGLKNGTISTHDAGLQALRDDPLVSTYAAAYLAAETAKSVHADPMNRNDWRYIYAGYNVGPQAARDLRGKLADTPNAKDSLGVAAAANPYFFRNGATGTQALQNYQNSISSAADDFSARYANGTSPVTAPVQRTTTPTPVPIPAPVTPAQPGASTDNFNAIVSKYLGDGNVHKINGTIVKYGICQSANPDVDVANLTRYQALQLYKTRYWNGIKGIDNMSPADAAAAFDVSYRHGPAYANRVLQRMNGTQSEALTTSFQRNTDPARGTVVAANAPQVKQDSLSSSFLTSAAHYVRDFLTPLAGQNALPSPALA